ncbi:unnamed protein product [Darwinula stevensoni]|uniref:CLIP domain-containing serine protease n=1 Tax=Darwinula stevensoni TaxID=69355 RepID=A0A7R8WXQ2_9CRUS|nr:unnamed protein product [Darwinula stevensoni]CAG0878652.1 unnamed protein product [Darwinula stevensoni]
MMARNANTYNATISILQCDLIVRFKNLILFTVFLLVCFVHAEHLRFRRQGSSFQNAGAECETPEPNVRPGTCTHIRECDELYSLLRGPNRNIPYVRQSICFIPASGGDPYVCCPAAKPPEPVPVIEKTVDKTKLFPDPRKYECGIEINDRIVNGEDAPLGAWPWMALLFYQTPGGGLKPGCGGTVINKRYVITAAHCVSPGIIGEYKLAYARLGEHKLSTNPDCKGLKKQVCQPPAIDAEVQEIIYHPNFIQDGRKGAKFDIALLRLAKDIDLKTGSIAPICLPFDKEIVAPDGDLSFDNKTGWVTGWGKTSVSSIAPICLPFDKEIVAPDGDLSFDNKTGWVTGWGKTSVTRPNNGSDVLQQLKVPIVPLTKCAATPVYKTVEFNEEHVCAGGEPNKDSCKGDSGGPLVVLRPQEGHAQYFLIGVVSFGTPYCGLIAAPGVYARVTHYLDWILEHVQE